MLLVRDNYFVFIFFYFFLLPIPDRILELSWWFGIFFMFYCIYCLPSRCNSINDDIHCFCIDTCYKCLPQLWTIPSYIEYTSLRAGVELTISAVIEANCIGMSIYNTIGGLCFTVGLHDDVFEMSEYCSWGWYSLWSICSDK